MNKIKSFIITAAGILFIALPAMAQPSAEDNSKAPHKPDPKNMEQLESAKIAFFTAQMDLTPEEAGKFWPVYNEYHKALCSARKTTRESFHAIKELSDKKSFSDVEMKQLLIQYTENCRKDEELERLYLDEFLKILPVEKVAKMYIAEEDFRAKMIKMWKKPGNDGDKERPDKERRP